jgi:hypothetical protein
MTGWRSSERRMSGGCRGRSSHSRRAGYPGRAHQPAPRGHAAPAGRAPCSAQRSCIPVQHAGALLVPGRQRDAREPVPGGPAHADKAQSQLHAEYRNPGEHQVYREWRRWSIEAIAAIPARLARTKGTASTHPVCRTTLSSIRLGVRVAGHYPATASPTPLSSRPTDVWHRAWIAAAERLALPRSTRLSPTTTVPARP